MPLPRKQTQVSPESKAAAEQIMANARAKLIANAPSQAATWIAAGGIAEVRLAWLNAKNRNDAELMAIYETAITSAGFTVYP